MQNTEHETQDDFTATYSPEDNKLRLYTVDRLDSEDYEKVRAAGFRWAPKQELFVAPMWTPAREDLLIEMAGEIGDEDTSLIDRAEERAERFEDYSDKRAADAHSAHAGVKSITDHIPMGQPILVGHHSEKHARRDAKRIENGMRKAVNMWETSKYWTQRAAGAIHHAKYKEKPAVRARRIKKIEAAKRKQERTKADAEKNIKLWEASDLSLKNALAISNYFDHFSMCFTLEEYPREPPASQYEGQMSLWSALDGGIITPEQAKALSVPSKKRVISWSDRWISHYNNRLLYEKAMLGEQGGLDLLKKPKRPKQPPLLNYRIPDGLEIPNKYHKNEMIHYKQVEMTRAEYKKLYTDHKGTKIIENSHRIRIACGVSGRWSRDIVFLTDSKIHKKPEPIEKEPAPMPEIKTREYTPPERTEFDDLKDTLREGVKVVSAPQLFVTPAEIAQKMVEYADIEPGHRVLEPSAGTGALLKAMPNVRPGGAVIAVEINQTMADALRETADAVKCCDFLECNKIGGDNGFVGYFDRIVMNPPFVNGTDIKHINHALTLLNPGGRLVALCANGPRQRAAFMDIAEHWEDLPAGSFKDSGTNVNVALMVLTNA